jgi:hypothetical protein
VTARASKKIVYLGRLCDMSISPGVILMRLWRIDVLRTIEELRLVLTIVTNDDRSIKTQEAV